MRNKNTGRLSQCLLASAVALLVASCGGGGGGGDGTSTGASTTPSGATGGSNIAITKDCVAGVTQGFAGNIENSAAGTGGSDGGGGDGGASGAGGGFGKVLGGLMRVTDLSDGAVVGEAVTDSVQGLVTVKTCNRLGPFLLTLEGQTGAKYYDEGKNAMLDFGSGNVFHALIDKWDEHVGVSPLTEAAYRYALNNYMGDPIAIANGTAPLRTSGTLVGLSQAKIQAANSVVANLINTQNITAFNTTSIKTLPIPIDANSSISAISANKYGVSAVVNGGLAAASAFYNPSIVFPALKYANDFAQDLTDGRIDGFGLDKNATSASSARSYHPTNLPLWTTAGNGLIANKYGNGNFNKTNISNIVYRLEYDVNIPIFGSDVNMSSRIIDTAVLSDDGVLDLIRFQDGVTRRINNFATNIKQIFYSRSSAMDDVTKSTFERIFQKAYILKNDGTVFTWGSNATCLSIQIQGPISTAEQNDPSIRKILSNSLYPKITNASGDANLYPVKIVELSNITDISVGPFSDTTLARTIDGSVFQWGRDVTGVVYRDTNSSIGIGQGISHYKKISETETIITEDTAVPIAGVTWKSVPSCIVRPTKVNGISNALYIAAGANANLLSTDDGRVYAWGKGAELGLSKAEPYSYANDISGTLTQIVMSPTRVDIPFKVGSLFRSPAQNQYSSVIYALGLNRDINSYKQQAWQIYSWGALNNNPIDFNSTTGVVFNLPYDMVPRSFGLDLSPGILAAAILQEDGRVFVNSAWSNYNSYINMPKIRFVQQVGQVCWFFGVNEKIYRLNSNFQAIDITQTVINGGTI